MNVSKVYRHEFLSYFIAIVWFVNGLFCKILNLVPRHEQIVARILGNNYSRPLTILIGFSEIIMAIWVLTKFQSKMNAIAQMIVVATMNIIEFIIAPDLLLWGMLNIVFAFMFMGLVFYKIRTSRYMVFVGNVQFLRQNVQYNLISLFPPS